MEALAKALPLVLGQDMESRVGLMVMSALSLTACSLPPATPTLPPASGGANAELFWMSVDWIRDSAGVPEVNRTLDFEDAKWTAREFIFHLLVLRVDELAEAGIAAGETLPYCLDVVDASFHLVAMTGAASPSQAGPHINRAIVAIHSLDTIPPAGQEDPQRCAEGDVP